jgi:integrase
MNEDPAPVGLNRTVQGRSMVTLRRVARNRPIGVVASLAQSGARTGPNARVLYTRKVAMTSGYVRRLMPRLARRAGVGNRVHAHGLRHTYAAQLRAAGVDIPVIRRQLGHTSIVTTVRYLDHLAPTAVIEAIKQRRWGDGA